MKEKEMIKCPICETKFIPRTFYPEEAIFSTPDGKKLSGFNGYINSSGVKPLEVIISAWKTYCPNCNYILRFVKEIVRKEKIQVKKELAKDGQSKYNSYYYGFPFGDYTQYLKEVTRNVEDQIGSTLKELKIESWENLYSIDDNFKFLVRFFANLENYCDSVLEMKNMRNLQNKIKKLKISKDVEKDLLQLNNIKDAIVQGEYELSTEEKDQINTILIKFVLYLIEKHVKPLINQDQLADGYDFIDLKDLKKEVKILLRSYLYSKFNNDPKANTQIRLYLDDIFKEKQVKIQ